MKIKKDDCMFKNKKVVLCISLILLSLVLFSSCNNKNLRADSDEEMSHMNLQLSQIKSVEDIEKLTGLSEELLIPKGASVRFKDNFMFVTFEKPQDFHRYQSDIFYEIKDKLSDDNTVSMNILEEGFMDDNSPFSKENTAPKYTYLYKDKLISIIIQNTNPNKSDSFAIAAYVN